MNLLSFLGLNAFGFNQYNTDADRQNKYLESEYKKEEKRRLQEMKKAEKEAKKMYPKPCKVCQELQNKQREYWQYAYQYPSYGTPVMGY